jgi:hypothetical protein|tara:strand:+ start:500 stop:772 length:273 start_codon:yes stop_codon:yes gene_type:complete
MSTFKEFMDMQPEDEFAQDMDMQQDDDLKELKKLVDNFNENAPKKDYMMSVMQDRDSDSFTLFIGPDEITTGSVPELIVRVKQIRHEHGF